jgi:hypothetical protein
MNDEVNMKNQNLLFCVLSLSLHLHPFCANIYNKYLHFHYRIDSRRSKKLGSTNNIQVRGVGLHQINDKVTYDKLTVSR